MTGKPTLFAGLLAITLCGCEGGESNVIVTQAGPDARFATADGLVEHYNEMTTTAPQDVRGVNELFYAENEQQVLYIAENTRFVDMLDLHEALYKRFGQGYFPDMKSAYAADGPAVITERSPQRAVASFVSDTGKSRTIQLVQADGRWWLSGNMLEELRAGIPAEKIRERSLVLSGISTAGRELIPRINRGEFASYEDANRALWIRAMQVEPGLLKYAQGGG